MTREARLTQKRLGIILMVLIIVGCSRVETNHMGDGVFDHVEYINPTFSVGGKTHVFLKNSSGRYILWGHHSVPLAPGDEFSIFQNKHYNWAGLYDRRTYDVIVRGSP